MFKMNRTSQRLIALQMLHVHKWRAGQKPSSQNIPYRSKDEVNHDP